jgi:hypothetical protein
MPKKPIILKGCDADRALMLAAELGKVRCWLTGFAAARSQPNALQLGVPGEDSLRQVQILLKDAALTAGK